jgi:hypothetical protein
MTLHSSAVISGVLFTPSNFSLLWKGKSICEVEEMIARLISLILLAAVLLAACTSPNSPAVSTPPAQSPTEAQQPAQFPTEAQQLAQQVSQAAQQVLASQLGVNLDAIRLDKIEAAQWSDACLGLGQPDEACAAVITSGYKVTFTVNGQVYEVRTNLDGQLVRLAGLPVEPLSGSQPAAVEMAIQTLATRLGLSVDLIRVISVEAVEWPNGCLGLERPDEMCTMAIVPGYHVTLEVNGTTFKFRTDLGGNQVREEVSLSPIKEQVVVLTWSRSGGIAGYCDQLLVFDNGQAIASSCKSSDTGKRVLLSTEQQAAIMGWTQRFTSFSEELKDPATADAMTINLEFTGSGQQALSDADLTTMLEFVSEMYTAVAQ